MRHVLDSDTPFHGRLLPTPPVPFYPPPSLELDPSSLSIADRYHSVIGKPINANIIICLGVQSPGLHILPPQCLSSGPHSSLQVMASSPFPRPLGQVTCTPSRWAVPSCMLSTPLDPVLSLSYQSWPPDRQLCTVPATPRPTRSWQSPGSNVLQLVVHLAGLGSVPFFTHFTPTLSSSSLSQPAGPSSREARVLWPPAPPWVCFFISPMKALGPLSRERETESAGSIL